jgi:hypothetical protein
MFLGHWMECLPRDGMFGLTALAGAGWDLDWEAQRILGATESRMVSQKGHHELIQWSTLERSRIVCCYHCAGLEASSLKYFGLLTMGNGGAWNGSWFVGQMFLELGEILGIVLGAWIVFIFFFGTLEIGGDLLLTGSIAISHLGIGAGTILLMCSLFLDLAHQGTRPHLLVLPHSFLFNFLISGGAFKLGCVVHGGVLDFPV